MTTVKKIVSLYCLSRHNADACRQDNAERRNLNDRRKEPTPFISMYTFRSGRRRAIRREADKCTYHFLDTYSTRLFIFCISLILLCIADAYCTLHLVNSRIAVEANPVMAFYLQLDNATFIGMKIFLTTAGIFLFCLCYHVPISRIGFSFSLVAYLLLIAYELNLIYRFAPTLIVW